MPDDKKQLFIVISQTGTVFSRLLKLITGAEYNHASVSLKRDLSLMYSFGRMNAYNPFYGGFVTESADFGTFKRFKNTRVLVLELDIPLETHDKISKIIDTMIANRKKYKYNYWGVYLAAFDVVIKRKDRYYCSEFVRNIITECEIENLDSFNGIIKPIQFKNIHNIREIYCGKLCDYKEFYQKNFVTVN